MRKALIAVALAGALASGRPTLLGQAWSLLTSIWDEGGCSSQPGGCVVTPQTDEGFGMDPNGKPGS